MQENLLKLYIETKSSQAIANNGGYIIEWNIIVVYYLKNIVDKQKRKTLPDNSSVSYVNRKNEKLENKWNFTKNPLQWLNVCYSNK